MSYANLSISPVRLAKVIDTVDYGKPSLTLVFLVKGAVESDKPFPIVAKIYGKTVEEKKLHYTQALDSKLNYLLMGETLLAKLDSPYLSGIKDSIDQTCATIPVVKMPSILAIDADNNEYVKTNICIVGGSSNKDPEIIHTQSGKCFCKHSFGVYSHKEQGKGVYSYVNCTIFNDNYGDLVRANSSVIIEGRLSVSYSDKTKLHYFDVVANNFKKLGRDDNSAPSTPRAVASVKGYPIHDGNGEEIPF